VPWDLFALYTALLASLAACFLGIGMLISTVARSVDVAQGAAFVTWLALLLFLDLVLLGLLIEERIGVGVAVGIALGNPLQAFRTAALLLFDPQLFLLGASSYVALDALGHTGLLLWATLYPAALGIGCATLGFLLFRRSDLP
jgi:ABC-2 type transport system permease protein